MSELFIIFYWTCVSVEKRNRGIDELRKKGPVSFIEVKFEIGGEIIG